MELKQIIALFRAQRKAFWATVLLCVVLGVVLQVTQKEHVTANLTLNVTRLGSDKTTDYQYHDFYRLQADERFADTVVRWLGSPRIVSDIYGSVASDDRSIARSIKAERLSSQMIQVTYSAPDEVAAQKLSRSIITQVNTETAALNKDQQEASWFTVVGNDPVAQDGRFSLAFVLAVSLALGLFLGFWTVLVRHYLEK